MPNKDQLQAPAKSRWTRPDDYVEALARRRTARKARAEVPRTEPEAPRFWLSTLPFLAVFGGLAVLTVAIMLLAWPHESQRPSAQPTSTEAGTAQKGWFQEAEREFHR